MSEESGTWPEQDVVDAWLDANGIEVPRAAAMALKVGTTDFRIKQQRRAEKAEADLAAAQERAEKAEADAARLIEAARKEGEEKERAFWVKLSNELVDKIEALESAAIRGDAA